MDRWSPRATAATLLLTGLMISACAAPPNREIGDAQEALKAAKAAGAERYASETYTAAADNYRRANEAVLAGDYRLALSRALDSRELSQSAARSAADAHARARDEALENMSEVAALLARASAAVEMAERTRRPKSAVRDVRQALVLVNADVQKASAAIRKEDFAGAKVTLAGVKERLTRAIAALDAPARVQPSRRDQS